jgi:hypothetical protein
LRISMSGSTGPETMSDSDRGRGKVGEVWVDVNRIDIFGYGSLLRGALAASVRE